MENNVLNSLALYRTKWSSDLLDETTLAEALVTKPHEVNPTTISYIFGYFNQGNVIDYITNGLGNTVVTENRQYEWSVMIEHDKAIPILDAKWQGATIDTTSSSTDVPGLGQSSIQLWLPEKWFGPGAIITFDDKDFQARVVGAPYEDGDAFVYTVVCADGKAESYIDPQLLAAGKQVSRLASAYEEYSEEADIVNYQFPFKLRNHLTTIRMSYDITGSAYSSVMVLKLRDPDTKKESMYISDYQEWMAMRQWFERVDRMSVYSVYNADSNGVTNSKGSNGRPVYIGAGLLQQIAPANKKTYTSLTLDLLDNFLSDLSFNIRGMGDRKFMALTGEMGLREFDRVLREKASGYTLVDTKFVTGSGQNLTLGGQFTTYKGLNGIELTLKHFPLYDDVIHNRQLHPVSGKPVESYRMTFLDVSTKDGQPNIRKVVRKDRELSIWHTGGSVAPGIGHAKSKSTLRSNAKDGYSVHFLTEQGIMIQDPTTCGELILEVEN